MGRKKQFNSWTDDEIKKFIGKATGGSMGTIDEFGFPHVLPMWHTFFEGLIYISFRIPKKKYTNLLANKKMSYTVEGGDDFNSYHGVMIQGDAEFVDDEEVLSRFNLAWTYRHFGSDADPYLNKIKHKERAVIRLLPTKTFTWDNRNMDLD